MVDPVPAYVETAIYLYFLLVAVAGVSLHAWVRTHRTSERRRRPHGQHNR